ncbi:MFS transporter [Nocardioides convexus]|uniref:MFS transporter n=1 Tax=Nocardioides convexus TaxID=2712224 RepID=UPI0024182BCC|nr:MFS transporter [Nocardioides convexus]
MPVAALADRWGRRRMLLTGFTIFAVASLAALLAGSSGEVIAIRALLGIGGAMIMPATLSLIRALFPDARERAFALGLWAATAAVGGAVGPIVGGALLSAFRLARGLPRQRPAHGRRLRGRPGAAAGEPLGAAGPRRRGRCAAVGRRHGRRRVCRQAPRQGGPGPDDARRARRRRRAADHLRAALPAPGEPDAGGRAVREPGLPGRCAHRAGQQHGDDRAPLRRLAVVAGWSRAGARSSRASRCSRWPSAAWSARPWRPRSRPASAPAT